MDLHYIDDDKIWLRKLSVRLLVADAVFSFNDLIKVHLILLMTYA